MSTYIYGTSHPNKYVHTLPSTKTLVKHNVRFVSYWRRLFSKSFHTYNGIENDKLVHRIACCRRIYETWIEKDLFHCTQDENCFM